MYTCTTLPPLLIPTCLLWLPRVLLLIAAPAPRRYDVTRRETFEQLFQWVRLVSESRKGLKPLKGTVVANKVDVQVQNHVSYWFYYGYILVLNWFCIGFILVSFSRARPSSPACSSLPLTPALSQDRISVHANDGAQFAKSHDLDFAQVCAHKLTEVEPIFSSLAAAFHQQYQDTLSTLASIV